MTEKAIISRVGIDLGKSTFHVCAMDDGGKLVERQRLTRAQLQTYLLSLERLCIVGMEACGGAHYWGRMLERHGHEVRLMHPKFVVPYVKSNKNDHADAEAICEAMMHPQMRFVSVKSLERQEIQHLHRMRQMAVAHRTALINQIRGMLLEHGIAVSRGAWKFRSALPEVLADRRNELSEPLRGWLEELLQEVHHLDDRVRRCDRLVFEISERHSLCRLLESIAGYGPLTATALVAAVGDASQFKNGRQMAAWVGLVPRQRSTGGRPRLLGISKRGDRYLRCLLIHGARTALRSMLSNRDRKFDRRTQWAARLVDRVGYNKATVALANKNLRTAWALLQTGQPYDANRT